MIFCNWISQKAGDKVPHTPLILPISTAGLKRALLCRWIWRKGGEWSMKRGRNVGIEDDDGCGLRRRCSARVSSGLCAGRVRRVNRRQGTQDGCGKERGRREFNASDHNSKHSGCCCQKWSGPLLSQQTKQISFAESQETVHFRTPWQMPLRKEDTGRKLSAPSERL